MQVVEQPGWEPLLVEGACFRARHVVSSRPEPAPRQGEHTRELAADLLGLDAAQIAELVRVGVLEMPEGTVG